MMVREEQWIQDFLAKAKKGLESEQKDREEQSYQRLKELREKYIGIIDRGNIEREKLRETAASFVQEQTAFCGQVLDGADDLAERVDKAAFFLSRLKEERVEEYFSSGIREWKEGRKSFADPFPYGEFPSEIHLREWVNRGLQYLKTETESYWQGFESELEEYLSEQFYYEACENDGQTFDLNSLCMSQIILINPVLKADIEVRKNYCNYLSKYVNKGKWRKNLFASAQLAMYKDILMGYRSAGNVRRDSVRRYKFYLLMDLLHILQYDTEILKSDAWEYIAKKMMQDLRYSPKEKKAAELLLSAVKGENDDWEALSHTYLLKSCGRYIRQVEKNLRFREKKPLEILVTATMSAGKSTLINAFAGKSVSRSQNMACTSKIHTIIGKAYDDEASYKYDYDLLLRADEKELLADNENNQTDRITAGVYYEGALGGKRIVIYDSPGVNYSGDAEHKQITDAMIGERGYGLLLYLMNATQLGTNDEEAHLNFVRETYGASNILFVINKIDSLETETEDAAKTARQMREYLKKKGFEHPMICPVSARAGFLAKKSMAVELKRSERREIDCLIDKFDKMNLVSYYSTNFPQIEIADSKKEERQLIKSCGLAYIEAIINNIYEGGE